MLLCFLALLGGWAGATGQEPQKEEDQDTRETQEAVDEPILERRTRPQPGDDVQVVFENRDRVEGVYVSETDSTYLIRIDRVEARIDKGRVDRLVVLGPAIDRYRQMRASIDDDDLERLVMLCVWLREHELYEEALAELDQVLAQAPHHGGALRLRTVVQELANLTRSERGEGAAENEAIRPKPIEPGAAPGGPNPTANANTFPFLTEDEINLIKVYEFSIENPPRVIIPRSTIERLLIDYSSDPLIPSTREGREAFYVKPHEEILDTMFRVRARELYSRVQVIDHPESMRRFRDHVHSSWLINSCATSRCHGGPNPSRLWLTNHRPTSAESVYTNFLILDRFRLPDGEPLIDYENPERSILLHMGLPGDDAFRAHPIVPGWSPIFRSRENRRFRQAVDWIRMMYRPRPDYPIEYQPPGERLPEPAIER